MYTVKAGNTTIHNPQLNDKQTVIFSPVLVKEVNKADAFSFIIYPINPGYASIARLTPGLIEVYDDSVLIFRGRVLNIAKGWQNQLTVSCESDLAMLNDSIVRPYNYSGTVLDYLTALITQHNSQVPSAKQFTVGSCQITGTIYRANENYPTTMSEIFEKLVGELGGFIMIRRSGSTNYIDYLLDSSDTCGQTITFGSNLLSLSQSLPGEDICTGIIPLGAKDEETGERLTIKSVNNNVDYLENATAVTTYGKIYKTVTYDDITTASALLSRAQAELTALTAASYSVELTAADLHLVDSSIDDIGFFEYVTLNDAAHNLTASFLCTKKTIDLANAANCKITLGLNTTVSSSARSAQTKAIAVQTVNDYGVSSTAMTAAIKAATDLITGVDGGYIKYHYDANGQPTEMLIMNAATESAATKIWRWNVNGLGYSNDGGQTYALAMTANGAIVADFIVAGILQSVNGNYSLDLATGKAVLKDAEITGGSINIASSSDQNDIIHITYETGGVTQFSTIRPGAMWIGASGGTRVEIEAGEVWLIRNIGNNTAYAAFLSADDLWLDGTGQSGSGHAHYTNNYAQISDDSDNRTKLLPGVLQFLNGPANNPNVLSEYADDSAKIIASNGNYVLLTPGAIQFYDSSDNLLSEFTSAGLDPAHTIVSLASEEINNPTSGDSFAWSSSLNLSAGKYLIIANATNGGAYQYVRGRIGLRLGYSTVKNESYQFEGAPSDATMTAVYYADVAYSTTAQVGVWVVDHAGKWNVDITAIKLG